MATQKWLKDLTVEHEQQVQTLRRLLDQGRSSERREAVRAILEANYTDERLVGPLIDLLLCSDLALREKVVAALAQIGLPAVAPLLTALARDHADFRKTVVLTLARIGPPARDAIPVLLDLVEDEWLGPWAIQALERIDPPAWWDRPLHVGWLWLAGGCIILAVGLVAGLAVGVGAIDQAPAAARSTAMIMGGLGVFLGLLIGWHVGGASRTALLAGSYGVGGAAAGFIIGWLMATFVEPVNRALGG